MKIIRLISIAALGVFSSASALADVTINLTGATAFRASSNNAILSMLGTPEYAYVGTQGLGGANRAIFKGTLTGIPGIVTVRTSWSGSAAGVKAVLNAETVQLLVESTPVSPAGTNVASPTYEFAVAKFAFSDVAQIATPTPTPALDGTPVGVVPFMFVANASAPATLNTMTDQLFNTIYASGEAPLSMFTGDLNDAAVIVIPTGRAASSGTRITMLAETGYGIARPVQQYKATPLNGEITDPELWDLGGNNGYSSNSFIRDLMVCTSDGFLMVGYLTISDALFVINNGGREMSYNGVNYTEENVKNGSYSLWGYQQFYNAPGLTAAEETFKTSLVNTIPSTMGTAGIPIPDMEVTRFAGDGGPIFPAL